MRIEIDNLERPQVIALLEEHLQDMYATSPPESVHALDVSKLKLPSITFWTGWDGEQLLGCVAMSQLEDGHAELKSCVRRRRRENRAWHPAYSIT